MIVNYYIKVLKNYIKGDLVLLEEIIMGFKNVVEVIKLYKFNWVLVYVFLKVKKEIVFEILEKIIFIKVCLVLKFVMEVVLKNNRFEMLELII